MVSPEEKIKQRGGSLLISRRVRILLTIGDILIVLTIITDLVYLNDLIDLNSIDMLAINIFMLSISYVSYSMKKKIKNSIRNS